MTDKAKHLWALFRTAEGAEKTFNTVFWFSLGAYIGLHTSALDDNVWAAVVAVSLALALGTRFLPFWWMEAKRWLVLSTDDPKPDVLPTPMLLDCPRCGEPHIDEGAWAHRPHKIHLCEYCDNRFKPCEYTTVGVAEEHEIDRRH